MKVLVVCEDPTHDRFVVLPIVERALADLGYAHAYVSVLDDPHLRGFPHLLDELPGIVADARMMDLIVVAVDRDGNRNHNEEKIAHAARVDRRVVACCAVEEVEAWMLALHRKDDLIQARWPEIRAHSDVKEAFALPFLIRKQWFKGPGQGRRAAMRRLGQGWSGLLQCCPEVAELMATMGSRIVEMRAR
jgi:hypothetical protein